MVKLWALLGEKILSKNKKNETLEQMVNSSGTGVQCQRSRVGGTKKTKL
ncbi:MAG: hypothetical protein CM15mP58_15590 [Burkholderiaceae bacterium]|nr:MAG: hypothetical protein CM15mP58_15590 [Burkholderiaceae bacterium]